MRTCTDKWFARKNLFVIWYFRPLYQGVRDFYGKMSFGSSPVYQMTCSEAGETRRRDTFKNVLSSYGVQELEQLFRSPRKCSGARDVEIYDTVFGNIIVFLLLIVLDDDIFR